MLGLSAANSTDADADSSMEPKRHSNTECTKRGEGKTLFFNLHFADGDARAGQAEVEALASIEKQSRKQQPANGAATRVRERWRRVVRCHLDSNHCGSAVLLVRTRSRQI